MMRVHHHLAVLNHFLPFVHRRIIPSVDASVAVLRCLIAWLFIFPAGCATFFQFHAHHAQINDREMSMQYTPEELKEDLHFMINIFEDVHPNLYAYSDQQYFQKAFDGVEQSLMAPSTGLEFYSRIAPRGVVKRWVVGKD